MRLTELTNLSTFECSMSLCVGVTADSVIRIFLHFLSFHLVFTWCALGVQLACTWRALGVHLACTWRALGARAGVCWTHWPNWTGLDSFAARFAPLVSLTWLFYVRSWKFSTLPPSRGQGEPGSKNGLALRQQHHILVVTSSLRFARGASLAARFARGSLTLGWLLQKSSTSYLSHHKWPRLALL